LKAGSTTKTFELYEPCGHSWLLSGISMSLPLFIAENNIHHWWNSMILKLSSKSRALCRFDLYNSGNFQTKLFIPFCKVLEVHFILMQLTVFS